MAKTGFRRLGIIGKRTDPDVVPTLRALIEHLRKSDRTLVLDDGCALHLGDIGLPVQPRADIGKKIDLAIVVGGDGTLLDAGRAVGPHGIPLLGINLGRLGFLVDVKPEDMLATVDEVLSGKYESENRLLLQATVHHADGRVSEPAVALNDAVVRNRDFARVMEFDTYLDGSFISHHRADGIIIATPTGSTAYALSGGGPVLHPNLEALALVPICPHTLSDRPLVVEAGHVIDVVVNPASTTQGLFTVDGQSNRALVAGDRVRIQRAERRLTLIHPRGYDYFKILRNKLRWGRGQNPPPINPNTPSRKAGPSKKKR